MRDAFTLIELLVVLVILTLIMGVVVPQGAKMLHRYEKKLDKMKQKHQLGMLQAKAFLSVQEYNMTIENTIYRISKKGIVFETRNDNH